jgi:hypothetical protein
MFIVECDLEILVFWDNPEKTILRQVYGTTFNWDEFQAAVAQLNRLAREVDHPISIIAEVSSLKRIPPDAIVYGSRGVRDLPANMTVCVFVTPSRLTLALVQAILAATRYEKLRIVSSLDEAYRLIEAVSKTSSPAAE